MFARQKCNGSLYSAFAKGVTEEIVYAHHYAFERLSKCNMLVHRPTLQSVAGTLPASSGTLERIECTGSLGIDSGAFRILLPNVSHRPA